MIWDFLFLTLLVLGSVELQQRKPEDLSKLLQEIFGPVASTMSAIAASPSCRTESGVDGKCTPSNSCMSGRAQENLNYEGMCNNAGDVCCPLYEIGRNRKCGVANLQMDSIRILSDDETTSYAEYPWVVAILRLEKMDGSGRGRMLIFACGGSLIHPRVVMTTAHNVIKLSDLRIRAGEWDTTSTDEVFPYQERDVDRIIVHEEYNNRRTNLHNDIALLVLEKPVDIQPNVNIICLPSGTIPPAPSTRCFSSGWGKDQFGKKGSYQTKLKKVELQVVSLSACQKDLRRSRLGRFFRLHESFICAEGKGGVDTCTGDGGSPLMCPVPGEDGRFMASGMVSWGIGCGESYPSVYADVSYLKPWVDAKMFDLGYSTKYYTI